MINVAARPHSKRWDISKSINGKRNISKCSLQIIPNSTAWARGGQNGGSGHQLDSISQQVLPAWRGPFSMETPDTPVL